MSLDPLHVAGQARKAKLYEGKSSSSAPPAQGRIIEARVDKGALGLKNTPEFRTIRSIVNAKINRMEPRGVTL